jgi:hypothetical protein
MNRQLSRFASVVIASGMLVLRIGPVYGQTQTPGQITKFDPSLNVVDSVITEDASGNIGIGTTTPAAALDVASGDLNLGGNILKGGGLFIHNVTIAPGAVGSGNTFIGQNAGNLSMTGNSNTGTGAFALFNNVNGSLNTAAGLFALSRNTSGSLNTANGFSALLSNTSGNFNTACGNQTLLNNRTGTNNTASGGAALGNNTTGGGNTGSGAFALFRNDTGTNNTAIGYAADVATANLQNATAIGALAVVDASNKIRLGDRLVTVIEGEVSYTFTSDKNQKENFQSVDGEEVLRKLSAVSLTSWNYRGHDPQQFRHYGPVAQEFFAAFGHDNVGTIGTATTINSGDLEGILMIAVQALEKRTAENAELRARIEALERLVAQAIGVR